jgi:hypothetical protein
VARTDAFSIWSGRLPILTALIVGTVSSLSLMFGVVLFAIGSVTILVWVIVTLAQLIIAMWHGLWRRAVSLLLITVFVWPIMGGCIIAGDYIHLALAYPFYAAKIAASDESLLPVSFDWGATGFAGSGNSERSLIYDPLDGPLLKVRGSKIPEDPAVSYSVQHLAGHFYVSQMSW